MHGKIGRQKMLAEIYMECGSIFGKGNTTMTDKQIIIDGIDVSRCRYYDDRYGYCDACRDDIDGASFTKCLYEDNCYYKQLLRKEQECEELKNELIDVKWKIEAQDIELNDNVEQLDQLKEQLEAYKMEAEEGKEINAELKAENEILKEKLVISSNSDKKTLKIIKTLTEIKEIIHFNKTNRLSGGACISIEQILQKISEVEDG